MNQLWDQRLSVGARQIRSSAIRDLLHVTERPEIISFAGGLPAPECFPTEALAAAAEQVIAASPVTALQYGPTEGYRPLRDWVGRHMAKLDVAVPTEQVLITSGSQQGLDLLGKLLIDPGAPVAVEDPTYVGALQAWRPYQPRFVTLPMDADGLDVDALDALLRGGERPRFLYVVSSFQNPSGTTMGMRRRETLIELAARYALPIVEDDPYGELVYEGERATPFASLDIALHGELRHVIYLSTFSKLLAPGLRVGWMVVPQALARRVVEAKQGLDLHTGSLTQATIYEACHDGLLDHQIPRLRDVYHVRRDAMLCSLHTHMPAPTHWTEPRGGMFVWLTLAPHLDATTLLSAALEQQVAFVPGAAFYANGGDAHTLRLNFSHSAAARIDEGVRRLRVAMDLLETAERVPPVGTT
jgi:2-aminoadipate transaminase